MLLNIKDYLFEYAYDSKKSPEFIINKFNETYSTENLFFSIRKTQDITLLNKFTIYSSPVAFYSYPYEHYNIEFNKEGDIIEYDIPFNPVQYYLNDYYLYFLAINRHNNPSFLEPDDVIKNHVNILRTKYTEFFPKKRDFEIYKFEMDLKGKDFICPSSRLYFIVKFISEGLAKTKLNSRRKFVSIMVKDLNIHGMLINDECFYEGTEIDRGERYWQCLIFSNKIIKDKIILKIKSKNI